MQAFFASASTVAIAEIGDKTQLLALVLACRFRRHAWIILLAILLSTALNHVVAAWVGQWLIQHIPAGITRYLLPLSFFAMAIWALIPDQPDKEDSRWWRYGPFLATFILFFIAEIGDKTQVATVLLSAKYHSLFWVTAGTTLGMMIANGPVVLAGSCNADRIPMQLLRRLTALIFILFGILSLWSL